MSLGDGSGLSAADIMALANNNGVWRTYISIQILTRNR